MRVDRLMWIFAGLVLVFGLPLLIIHDKSRALPFAGLSVLALGGFGLALAADGVRKGEIRLHPSVIRRADHPLVFWATIALVAAAGAGTIATAIWVFVFKAR